MNKLLAALTVGIIGAFAVATTALAAQGVITEVNPSGVTGIIVEDGTRDEVRFINPPKNDVSLSVGQWVEFTKSTNKGGRHLTFSASPLEGDPGGGR